MIPRKNTFAELARPQGTVLPLMARVMLFGAFLAGAATVDAGVCILPDNGTGTVNLPPECTDGYVSIDDFHMIIDGLPEGSTIRVAAVHFDFANIVRTPGGVFPNGEIEEFSSTISLSLRGTGELESFSGFLLFFLSTETHTGARILGRTVQEIDAEIFRLEGQPLLFGGPFSLFRITAGSDFGLPSPGEIKLVLDKNGVCEGGGRDGTACAESDRGCPASSINGVCEGGPNDTFDCDDFRDCEVCVGGIDEGLLCRHTDCPDGVCEVGLCVNRGTCICPGGCDPQYWVSGFFNVNYQIEFVGRAGGPLDSLAGTSTGTVRMQTGARPRVLLRATKVNGVPLPEPHRREVNINPGDEVTIEARVQDLIPTPLGAYQVGLPRTATPVDSAVGSLDHAGDPIVDEQRADWVFFDLGGACVGGSNDCNPCQVDDDCPDGNTNGRCVGGTNPGQTCGDIEDCEGGGVCVDPGQCETLDLLLFAFLTDVARSGAVFISTPPPCFPFPIVEADEYLGESNYVASANAAGDFTIDVVTPGVNNFDDTVLFDDAFLEQIGFPFDDSGVIIHFPPPPPCNDADCVFLNDTCNEGRCNQNAECEAFPINENGPCDDEDPCTPDETCVNGTCTGTPDTDPPFVVHGTAAEGETTPCSGYIGPRLESDNGVDPNLGVDTITFVFNEPVRPLGGGVMEGCLTCFEVSETGTGGEPANTISEVHSANDITVEVVLDRLTTLQEWTTVRAIVEDECGNPISSAGGNQGPGVNEPDRIDISRLPADVNQDQDVTDLDLADLREFLQFDTFHNACEDLLYFDIDRDGVMPEPQDLIRFRQMISGSPPASQSWISQLLIPAQP